MWKLLLAAWLVVAVGCGFRGNDLSSYQEDATPMPRVALLPLRDSSGNLLPWDVAEELFVGLKTGLMDQGGLLFVRETEIAGLDGWSGESDLFAADLSHFEGVTGCDFVVIMELTGHERQPYRRGSFEPLYLCQADQVEVLVMEVQVRIIDLRGRRPRVVLHELATSNHMVPRGAPSSDADKRWGRELYPATPMGQAHRRLVSDLCRRLQSVVDGKAA